MVKTFTSGYIPLILPDIVIGNTDITLACQITMETLCPLTHKISLFRAEI